MSISIGGSKAKPYALHTASLADSANLTFAVNGIINWGGTGAGANAILEVTGNSGTNWATATPGDVNRTGIATSTSVRIHNGTGGAITNLEIAGVYFT